MRWNVEQIKIEHARMEMSVVTELATMAVEMVDNEEYSGVKRVLNSLQTHIMKANTLLTVVPEVAEKKPAKK